MSGKKNKSDLNTSGISPLVLNMLSPQTTKNSPAKNQAVFDAIDQNAKKLIAGYDKWMLNERKGLNSLNAILSLRENSRTSSEPPSYTELQAYCDQLKEIETVLINIVSEIAQIQSQIESSQNIQKTMSKSSEDPLLKLLESVDKFLIRLKELYEASLSIKKIVIQNIAHTSSSEESHVLIASWYCDSDFRELSKMIVQLKISPAECRWEI